VTGDDRETCPGTRLVFDWYDIPTEQSFRRDLLKRRTNLKANPERLISRGKPRRQGSGNMMVEAAESCMFSFFPSLSKLYSTWKAQWMGASTSFERTSSDRLREHRQDSLFLFLFFRLAIRPQRRASQEKENFPPFLGLFLFPRFGRSTLRTRGFSTSIAEIAILQRIVFLTEKLICVTFLCFLLRIFITTRIT